MTNYKPDTQTDDVHTYFLQYNNKQTPIHVLASTIKSYETSKISSIIMNLQKQCRE